MGYIKCYLERLNSVDDNRRSWGQFVILDLDYITYFSNYKYNNKQNHSTIEFQIDKYNSMKNKLKPTTSYKELNTLQIIYETQFDFRGCDGAECVVTDPEYGTLVEYSDEEMSNPNTIKELDTSAERDDSRMIPLYTQISRPIIMNYHRHYQY